MDSVHRLCGRLGFFLVLAMFGALVLGVAAPVAAETGPQATNALAWLRGQQNGDGGYPGLSGPDSDPSASADAALAFIAAGISPRDVKKGDGSLLDYLHSSASNLKAGPAAKDLLIAANIGEDPASFGGANLFTISTADTNADGAYGNSTFVHALVVLAHAIARSPDVARQLDGGYLLKMQREDGGWSFDAKGTSDTNTTAVVVQALVASGQGGEATTRGMAYMEGMLQASNLYPFDAQTGEGDANSTAFVLQAKLAARAAPAEIDRTRAALLTLQNASGAFRYQNGTPDDNLLATVQAIPAINGRAFPVISPVYQSA